MVRFRLLAGDQRFINFPTTTTQSLIAPMGALTNDYVEKRAREPPSLGRR
jgi:hypothetical protein